MKFNLQRGDKHVIVEVEDQVLEEEDIQHLREQVAAKYNEGNVVLHVPYLNSLSDKVLQCMVNWNKETRSANKSFVISALDQSLAEAIEDIEVTHTLSEAEDLIFMEEVERDLDLDFDT